MLQLYDLNKVKIAGLKNYKDLNIESNLSSGDKKLSFLYPLKEANGIVAEGYVQTRTAEFVIKELGTAGEWKTIKAILNTEDLEGNVFEHFDTTNKSIDESLTLALAGTGWTVGTCNVSRRRTVRKTNSSTWEIIQEAKKVYRSEIEFDTLNKKINIFEKRGTDKGTYFIESLNLKDLDVQSNSYDFYTRIIAIGKDDLRVTLENYQYSSKKKTFIWVDDRYTDKNALTEDAMSKLNELSKPYRAYSANIIDLASMNAEYKDILSYNLGDTITLISKDKEIKEKQRIVKIVEYPEEPERNACEIANTTLKFEDLQKEFQDTSNTVNNITVDDGTIDGETINGISSKKIYDLEANVVRITDLTVVNAKIESLYADKASIGQLNAVEIKAGKLIATKATITDLEAFNVKILNLKADKADILNLNATNARVDVLEVDTGNIKVLLAGNLTSTNIQSLNLTSDKVTVANGFIKNAMIDTIDVSKINAGIINTNKFTIKSADGGIEIVGATQQFKDKNGKVRIQMGKDSKGDFNFIICAPDGVTTLIDHTGIKKDAIADDLIVKEMIGKDAIGEKQLDYSSFAEGFNKDTNTHTLKATHIKLDNQNQTLDLAFNSLKTEVQNIEIGGRNLWINKNVGSYSASNIRTLIGATYKNNTFTIASNPSDIIGCRIDNLDKSLIVTGKSNLTAINSYYKFDNVLQQNQTIAVVNGIFKFKIDVPVGAIYLNLGIGQYPYVSGYTLADIKVETGNKATDWTPAPEDVAQAINVVKEITTSNSTAIEFQQGQIKVAITNSQIIKDGKTILLKDAYNGTVQTVNSTVETIGKHQSTLDANTGAITDVKTDVTEVKKSLEGITTRVGSSETSIDGINKSVSTANSEIAQLKDSISLKVNETYVNTAKSQATTDANNYTIKQVSIINQKTAGIEISLGGIASKVTNLESIETSNRKVGSFRYIRDWLNGSNVNTGNYWCELEVWVGDTNIARGKAATSSVPLVNGNLLTDGSIATTPYVSMASVGWQWVQIDLGTERKDVDMIRTFHYWYDARQFKHKLQVSTDGATWVDLYNSDISGAYIETNMGRSYVINESYTESRLNSAEQKITDKAIISTVQATVNTAKTDAITSANASTDGKLNAYSTTSAMTSAITQSAAGIKQEVSNTYITTGNANNSFATKSSVAQTDLEWRATFKSSGGYNLIPNGKALLNTNGWRNNGGTRFNREYYEMGSAFAMSMPNGINFEGWIKLERGVDYVYSAKFYSDVAGTGSACTPLHYWIGTSEANNSYITVLDHNQGTILARWQDLYVHFITRPDVDTFFKPFIYGGPTTAVASITNIMLAKGTMVTPWVPNSNEVYSGNTSIDSGGVTIYNGAIRVLDGAGNEVLKGDSSGISFSGRLQPRDNRIRLFGEECKLEGGYGAIRMAFNQANYIAIDNDFARFFNKHSANGTNYVSLGVDWQGHTQLSSNSTMLKLLGAGAPGVQARWAGDGGYCPMQASAFLVSSKAEFKDNIEEPTDINFTKILMETEIKKYNLKKEMDLIDKMPTVLLPSGKNPIKADLKLGLILDDLTEDARVLIHPTNMDGADLYSMCSILWIVNQEQERRIVKQDKRIEKLEQLLIM
ncbi:phage tail spike protein [Clostridium gasigenes]|uniref:phage tail spike protein n=1 Tax=Clostridium gasigenes TaxID=94869 RepID=UPI00209A6E9F|nr:phage tail spike protein [Clostridium gasigenes]